LLELELKLGDAVMIADGRPRGEVVSVGDEAELISVAVYAFSLVAVEN